MKQRLGLHRNVSRPTPGDPWGVEQLCQGNIARGNLALILDIVFRKISVLRFDRTAPLSPPYIFLVTTNVMGNCIQTPVLKNCKEKYRINF